MMKISFIPEDKIEIQMVDTYREGLNEFNSNNYLDAAKNLMRLNFYFHNLSGHPRQLMSAYSYFYDDYSSDAIYHRKIYKNLP